MAQLLEMFDATKFDPSQGSSSLPVGKHVVSITHSEVKGNKAGDGGYLQLELCIQEGPNFGLTGPMRLNLYSQSDKAKEIAHRQLSALCHAIGVYQIQNTQQLHGHKFMVDVRLQREPEAAAKGYTEVGKIYDANGSEPTRNGPSAAHVQAPAAAPVQAPAAAPVAQAAPAAWGAAPAQAAPAAPVWGAAAAPAAQPAAPAWAPGGAAPGAAPWAQ